MCVKGSVSVGLLLRRFTRRISCYVAALLHWQLRPKFRNTMLFVLRPLIDSKQSVVPKSCHPSLLAVQITDRLAPE